jgi:putative membrane protein
MRKLTMFVAALAAVVMLAVPATGVAAPQANGGAKASKADQKWLNESLQTDLFEVRGGELAKTQGQSKEVVKLGEMLARQHSVSYATNKKLAAKLIGTVPNAPSAKMKAQLKKLEGMSGASFDQAYVAMMAKGHKESIMKTKVELKGGSSKAVLAAAKKGLAMYEMHLKSIEKVASTLGSGETGTGGGAM